MSDGRDLRLYVVPPGRGASFVLRREGGLVIVAPLSALAADWLVSEIGDEASWYEGALVVEQRYLPDLVDAIIDAGFLFEGDDGEHVTH